MNIFFNDNIYLFKDIYAKVKDMSIIQEYLDLIKLTKTCLQEEHSPWLAADPESYNYFKTYATQKKSLKEPNAASLVKKEEIKNSLAEVTYKKESPVKSQAFSNELFINEVKEAESQKNNAILEKEEKIQNENSKHFFELTPLKPCEMCELSDVEKTVRSLFPHLTWLKKPIVMDPEILIVYNETDKKEMAFLSNLTKALQIIAETKLLPLSKFQANSNYPKLKMIVFAKSNQIKRDSNIRYFEMPHIVEWLQNPKAKPELWKTLKNVFFS